MLCCIGEWICSFYNFFFWESKWVQPTLGAICALVTYTVGGRSVCKPFNFFMWVFFGWHYYWSYIIRDVNEVELWYNRILSYFILHKSEGETSLGCEIFHLCIGIFILIYIYILYVHCCCRKHKHMLRRMVCSLWRPQQKQQQMSMTSFMKLVCHFLDLWIKSQRTIICELVLELMQLHLEAE